MKIRNVRATNFRTLENFSLSLFPNYCALSGRNNAGKSTIIAIIEHFFDTPDDYRIFPPRTSLSFTEDSTQWSEEGFFEIAVDVELSRSDDSELYFFVDKFTPEKLGDDKIIVTLSQVYEKDDVDKISCFVQNQEIDTQASREVLKKFKTASNLIVHNSTQNERSIFWGLYT